MAHLKKIAGDRGEELAAQYLQAKGYSIIERNWRRRFGEIDIIALKSGVMAFCEVKLSQFSGPSHPEIRVDLKKQFKLARLARAYLAKDPPGVESCRFDIISVKNIQGRDVIEHIENAFFPPDDWD